MPQGMQLALNFERAIRIIPDNISVVERGGHSLFPDSGGFWFYLEKQKANDSGESFYQGIHIYNDSTEQDIVAAIKYHLPIIESATIVEPHLYSLNTGRPIY